VTGSGLRGTVAAAMVLLASVVLSGCAWRGVNSSMRLPGTAGGGSGSYELNVQLPDVGSIEPNSRVRVGDVTVGSVTRVQREGWHGLLTVRIDGNVELPANTVAKIGQTSLLGTVHVELGPPTNVAPQGKLHNGSLIPLSSSASYPTTEQTLAALSLLFNGGGLGQVQDLTKTITTAFSGRENDVRSLTTQLEKVTRDVDEQTGDIISTIDSLNRLFGQFTEQKPVLDRALRTVPDTLAVLKDQRDNLVEALDQFGKLSALTAESINQTKQALVQELKDLGPVAESLANAGPALTRSLSLLTTMPWPKENITKWIRGDYANATMVFDFTLSRLDAALFTGTRFEGKLTELELQWGRTIGQTPSPYTSSNPLVAPYHLEGP
jgi:phospholipid/cholesterol/gamma-HCH transport system substrate-binding protein